VSAFGQDVEEEEERDVLEFAFYGGVGVPSSGISDFSDTLGAKTGWSIGADFGYFASTSLVVGVNFTYYQFGIDTESQAKDLNHRLYSPAFYAKYYFWNEGRLAPYLKAHVGADFAKFTTFLSSEETGGQGRFREQSYDPVLAFGFGGGFVYYTSWYSGLFLEAAYHYGALENAEKVLDNETLNFGESGGVIDIHAGIAVFFGG
jgi:hypothetical protein